MSTKPSLPKVRRPFDHVVLQGHMTNLPCYISTTTMTMASKLGRAVLYNEELLLINSQNLLISCSCKVTWKTKTSCLFSTNTRTAAMKRGRVVSSYKVSSSTYKIRETFKHVIFWDDVTNQKSFTSSTTMPETKQCGIKPHDHSNKWLCEVTWKTKNIKSDLS